MSCSYSIVVPGTYDAAAPVAGAAPGTAAAGWWCMAVMTSVQLKREQGSNQMMRDKDLSILGWMIED